MRILFISNGHGESAIVDRIADEVRRLEPSLGRAHFPLVGLGDGDACVPVVGPRRSLPSGGLVAMGNIRAFVSDVRAGFVSLFFAQVRFLRSAHRAYDLIVAVGDVYALGMALLARLPVVFVGTAKSAYVAPYGSLERRIMRRAVRIYVRDERTANRLRALNVPARFAGNVIADLHRSNERLAEGRWIGVLPGSRGAAYADAVRLAAVLIELGKSGGSVRAFLSVAPTLQAKDFADALRHAGWTICEGSNPTPFTALKDEVQIVAWTGDLGQLLASSEFVLGQAGTANEAAASWGVPLVALADDRSDRSGWYRMRQRRL
ncbi:MAG: hypothetical protein JO060_12315, partial [Candidatus Eremiobacteraeota bacterium]|nr:hypothetical protein [Candidatus Eremiobacteraeota bacterium]